MADNEQPSNHWAELPEKIGASNEFTPAEKALLLAYWESTDTAIRNSPSVTADADLLEKFFRLAFEMIKSK